MARFSKSVRLPYTPEQCFDLVSDIRRYPDFIKWITAMRVTEEVALGDGASSCLGDAVIGFKGFTERFSTRVTKTPSDGNVIASLVKGPFRRLRAEWQITPQDKGTDVRLEIDYDFKNPFIGMLAAANHDLAVSKILQAFLDEGRRRFGAVSGAAPGV
ncbi:MAG: type II toxin-antitoxin system RatA family toxin [Oricola sp.]|uniref:type II toxin-antitoxin system RatA family toxin n=1 Tax=Hyphomonas jannaschiana TaxID=86 RepID=UPI00320BE43F|nr:type II toxin-antitoxin system RatA family toxin [Oricola sp.]